MTGEELRSHRKKAGLSQRELAEAAGVHRCTVGVVALRDEVASLMSKEQIAEAQALARDWFSQQNK